MILSKLQGPPAKTVPVGMLFVAVGMMFLVLGISWQKLPALAQLWPDQNDFLRGFCLGFAIVMETTGLVINVAAAKSRQTL